MLRAGTLVLLMAMCGSTALADTPLYAALALEQKPLFSGCSIAATRDAMVAALKKAGYTGALPKIGWDTNHAAVLLLSTDGTQKPYTYVPGKAQLQVVVQRVPANAANRLFVMEIDKSSAAATSCQLADASTVTRTRVAPAAVTYSTPTILRGSAAGTAASSK